MNRITNNSLKRYYFQKINKNVLNVLNYLFIDEEPNTLNYILYFTMMLSLVFTFVNIFIALGNTDTNISYALDPTKNILEPINITLIIIRIIFALGGTYLFGYFAGIPLLPLIVLFMSVMTEISRGVNRYFGIYKETLILIHKSGEVVEHEFNTKYPALEKICGRPAYEYRLPEASDIAKVHAFIYRS